LFVNRGGSKESCLVRVLLPLYLLVNLVVVIKSKAFSYLNIGCFEEATDQRSSETASGRNMQEAAQWTDEETEADDEC